MLIVKWIRDISNTRINVERTYLEVFDFCKSDVEEILWCKIKVKDFNTEKLILI